MKIRCKTAKTNHFGWKKIDFPIRSLHADGNQSQKREQNQNCVTFCDTFPHFFPPFGTWSIKIRGEINVLSPNHLI